MARVSTEAMSDTVRIGSRGSRLALAQAEKVALLLKKELGVPSEVVVIQTAGDLDKVTPLSEMGGKGVFIKALEAALLSGEIDIAVHSFKDLTSRMPDGLQLSGFLAPESCADVAVMAEGCSWETLPVSARVGTGSLRRAAFIKRYWPHLEVVPIRGNIESRISKLETNDLSAVILSEVGLMRLEIPLTNVYRFDFRTFLPAPGQGVIALQTRVSDKDSMENARRISDSVQMKLSVLDYQILSDLSFNCQIPLGVFSSLNDGRYDVCVTVFSEDFCRYLDLSYQVSILEASQCIDKIVSKCRSFFSEVSL